MELKLVAATYEVQKGNRLFRISTGEGGTILRCVMLDSDVHIWSHGTLVWAYDENIEAFSPQCIATLKKFNTVEDAVAVIESI